MSIEIHKKIVHIRCDAADESVEPVPKIEAQLLDSVCFTGSAFILFTIFLT